VSTRLIDKMNNELINISKGEQMNLIKDYQVLIGMLVIAGVIGFTYLETQKSIASLSSSLTNVYSYLSQEARDTRTMIREGDLTRIDIKVKLEDMSFEHEKILADIDKNRRSLLTLRELQKIYR